MAGKHTEEQRAALKLFRERREALPDAEAKGDALKQYAVGFRQQRKQLSEMLRAGPSTVPTLAQQTELSAHLVLWHIAGMRKYGVVQEAGVDGDYVVYELAKPSK